MTGDRLGQFGAGSGGGGGRQKLKTEDNDNHVFNRCVACTLVGVYHVSGSHSRRAKKKTKRELLFTFVPHDGMILLYH